MIKAMLVSTALQVAIATVFVIDVIEISLHWDHILELVIYFAAIAAYLLYIGWAVTQNVRLLWLTTRTERVVISPRESLNH